MTGELVGIIFTGVVVLGCIVYYIVRFPRRTIKATYHDYKIQVRIKWTRIKLLVDDKLVCNKQRQGRNVIEGKYEDLNLKVIIDDVHPFKRTEIKLFVNDQEQEINY